MLPQRSGEFMPDFISGFLTIVQNPIYQQAVVDILKQLDPVPAQQPKDNVSVAQSALEAYRNGKLSKEQAMQIILIALQDDARSKGQIIDITAKRSELAKLFN